MPRGRKLGHPVSADTREKIREAALRQWRKPETREKMLQVRRSAESREKHRQAALRQPISPQAREARRQASLGKPLSIEHREKIQQSNLGRRMSPEACQKIRRAALGRKHSPETREKLRQARLTQTFPAKMTSIERLLHAEFRKRRLHFEMHKTMFGRFQPDFVFEAAKLIVQADGDYWHSTPRGHRQDAAFAVAAHADGWSVWRFGEKEIHMHAAACARAAARFVRDHQPHP